MLNILVDDCLSELTMDALEPELDTAPDGSNNQVPISLIPVFPP